MGKFIAVFGGIVAMAGGVALLIFSPKFWAAFVNVVFGFIPPILIFGGFIGLIAGISSIKDAKRTKKLEQEAEPNAVKTDITKSEDPKQLAAAALREFGQIDILVNNAGGSSRDKQTVFHESTEAAWDHVLNLNMKGTFRCTRAVINHMIERRSGKIVSIASIAAMIGEPGMADYSAVKAGIVGFTRVLAKEVARFGINVNSISPGEIQTGWTVKAKEDKYKRLIGLGRLGKPEEIADAVVFLASPRSSYVTGQVLAVNGGMYM